jgi:hypothetical protein
VAAGAGMIAMTISNEYTWFSRTAERLPDGVDIVVTVEEQSWFRPWTQIWPYTKRFAAVDLASARINKTLPDQRMADLYFFGRWSPVNKAPMIFDCAARRSALLIDGARFDDKGAVVDANWRDMAENDPLFKLVCET